MPKILVKLISFHQYNVAIDLMMILFKVSNIYVRASAYNEFGGSRSTTTLKWLTIQIGIADSKDKVNNNNKYEFS